MLGYKERHHIPKEELKLYYKIFKSNIQRYLEKAQAILGKQELDFSYQELDSFGLKYKQFYTSPESVNLTYDELLDVFTAYYGEAWIFYFGGVWSFRTYIRDTDYGYPCIEKSGPERNYPICPTNCAYIIEKGIVEFISEDIETIINYYKGKGYTEFKAKINIK